MVVPQKLTKRNSWERKLPGKPTPFVFFLFSCKKRDGKNYSYCIVRLLLHYHSCLIQCVPILERVQPTLFTSFARSSVATKVRQSKYSSQKKSYQYFIDALWFIMLWKLIFVHKRPIETWATQNSKKSSTKNRLYN